MANREPGLWVPQTAFVMPLLPPRLNVDPVLTALLHGVAFLELSEDEAVDPDWSVEAMEHVSLLEDFLDNFGAGEPLDN